MESGGTTEDALYGDLDVTCEGEANDGPFRILFRPHGQKVVSAPGYTVDNAEALNAFLHALGLPDRQIETLCGRLQGSLTSWLRVLVSTAVLRKYRLI